MDISDAMDGHELAVEQFESGSLTTLTQAIVRLIGEQEKKSVQELTPLDDYADATALESLANSLFENSAQTEFFITFQYEGYYVVLDGDGTIRIFSSNGEP